MDQGHGATHLSLLSLASLVHHHLLWSLLVRALHFGNHVRIAARVRDAHRFVVEREA